MSVPPSPSSSPDPPAPSRPLTTAEVLASTNDADWRNLDPEHTVYVDLPSGRVVIELAPAFAPRHVANIRTLVRGHYFDGLAVVRSQDNYVVQWGDPAAEKEPRRPLPATAAASLAPELDRTIGTDLSFTRLPDGDVYAPVAGFSQGFPVAVDDVRKKIGLTHCYGMVGVGRGEAADSGNGAELYVVIGHSPRHLDRNVTLVGRVVQGMDRLSTLPRGSGPFGFYEDRAQRVPLKQVRLGAELPESERSHIQSLRTDTEAFRNLIEARRTRRESWFLDPVGKVELCNVPLPVREAKVGPTRRP